MNHQLYSQRLLLPVASMLTCLAQAAYAQGPWLEQQQPNNLAVGVNGSHIQALALPSPTSVWALCANNQGRGSHAFDAFYSTNEGQSWQREVLTQRDPIGGGGFTGTLLQDAYTADGQNIWLLVTDLTTNTVSLRRSTTGLGGFATQPALPAAFTHIRFFNATTGVALGPATAANWTLYRTSDGGISWSLASQLPRLANDVPAALTVLGSALWVTTTQGEVLRTDNQGQTWAWGASGAGTTPTTVAFQNASDGLLLGRNRVLRRTTDGGQSWQPVAFAGPLRSDGIVAVPGASNTYISFDGRADCNPCSNKGSAITTDNGATWRELENTIYYSSIAVGSPTRAWAGTSFQAKLYRSANVITSSAKPRRTEPALAYPNPTSGRLQLAPTTAPRNLQLLDATGRRVGQYTLPAQATTWDVSGYRPGVYTLVCTGKEQVQTQRLVVTP